MTTSAPATPAISKRALRSAQEQTRYLINKVKAALTEGKIATWRDITTKFSIPLPDNIKDKALDVEIQSPAVLNYVLEKYYEGTEARLLAALQQNTTSTAKLKITPEHLCRPFTNNPEVKLYPEQDPVFHDIYHKLFTENKRAVLCPGGTGAGKTAIGAAVIDQMIVENRHTYKALPLNLPYPILWITVRNAVEQTRRFFEMVGLGNRLDKDIHVLAYTEIATNKDGILVKKEELTDPFSGEVAEFITWMNHALSLFVVLDECHKLMKWNETLMGKAIAALEKLARQFAFVNTKYLLMSATPVERVNDARAFVCMADIDYGGVRITFDNFNQSFANIISPNPAQPIAEASRRLFNALSSHIVEIPYYPWPYKAINAVKLLDFETTKDQNDYNAAWDEYCDFCAKMGKDDPNSFNARFTMLTVFRRKVEPIRVSQIIKCMLEDLNNGRSVVMGAAYVDTVIKAAFSLIDDYGHSRDDIAIIWGGRPSIKPDHIITPEEFIQLQQDALSSGEGFSRETFLLIKKNLQWQKDRLLFGDESEAKQDERYERLKEYGLIGIQNLARRQAEIDKFMSGRAKICLFTAESGGTGLSLEHSKPCCLPRSGYFPVIYNGKTWTQLMGRLPRRNSISHTHQYICGMNRTIEASHVIPILDKKLQTIGEFATRKGDLAMILAKEGIDKLAKQFDVQNIKIRDLETATQQALNDERTQLHADHDDSDDDNDNDLD